MRSLGPYALSVGITQDYIVGSPPGTGAIVLINQSPFTLACELPGIGEIHVPASMMELVQLANTTGFTGTLTITPIADIDVTGTILVATLRIRCYGSGEAIPGTYPAPITGGAQLGAYVSNPSVVNNAGNPAPTAVVSGQPYGVSSAQLGWNNDGSGTFGGGKGSVDNAANMTVNDLVAAAITMSQQEPFWQSYSSGSTLVDQYRSDPLTIWKEPVSGHTFSIRMLSLEKFVGGAPSGGILYWLALYEETTDPSNPQLICTWNVPNGTAGTVTAPALGVTTTPILYPGNQITRDYEIAQYFATGIGVIGNWISLPLDLANTPTSISFTVTSSSNYSAGTIIAANVQKTGFLAAAAGAASGRLLVVGTYTTAGNTLLAVDASARTIDHHCDGCDTQRLALPFAALRVETDPFFRGAAYICPTCGQVECFNGAIASAATAGYDLADPHSYPTRVYLARALWQALGLPVPD